MPSLLDNVTRDQIDTDPFPHVFVRDVLPQDYYNALSESFPPFSMIGWADESRPPPSNHRYQLSAWLIGLNERMPEVWKEFSAYHSSPAFFAQVVELFRDHWPAALKAALGGDLLGHRMGLVLRDQPQPGLILQDARAEINTPVTAGPSSSRGPHLDTANRLFTCLLYLRHPDDDAVGGDLELLRWKHGPRGDLSAYSLPSEDVEVVKVIPYRANQMVIFPQTLHSLHGVGIRHPTPHTRRYMFISAELSEDWLTLPAASVAA